MAASVPFLRKPAHVPTVLGIVVTRNEWPLVGVAIAHALTHHVDAVCVVDHASTDGTAEGLGRLESAWGARLRVLRVDEDAFFQEAFNLAALEATRDMPGDWVYVFDADEFLLAPQGGLRGCLAAMADDVDAVRYRLDHYVAPRDHDPSRPEELLRFRYRVRNPDQAIPPLEPIMERIERGDSSLFDVPFLSKVVVRRRPGTWLTAGAHVMRCAATVREREVDPETLRCAHLTYPSLDRLRRKAALGANKARNGFPILHGWQNQLLARVEAAGGLERFWHRHSIAPGETIRLGPNAEFSEDEVFPRRVGESLEAFREAIGGRAAHPGEPAPPAAAPLPLAALVSAIRVATEQAGTLAETNTRLERRLASARAATERTGQRGVDAVPYSYEQARRALLDHRRVARMRRWLRLGVGLDRLLMNTRLLRDDLGSPCLAHLCDWCITDVGFHGNLRRQPRTVFVRSRFPWLRAFFTEYLPRIDAGTRFVLVTGSDDVTVPRQTDQRYGRFENTEFQVWFDALQRDPRLVRWYADNVDTEREGLVPIPCGTAGRYGCAPSMFVPRREAPIRLRSRPLKAICSHRVREGEQWEKRRAVTAIAREHWRGLVDVEESIPCGEFAATLARYPFTICVTGGGLDAAPKAWVALLAGSIPIIERNTMAPAYAGLPVAWVDDWTPASVGPDKLERWVDELAPSYEEPALRRQVLGRLSLGHWWRKIRDDAHRGRSLA